MAGCDWAMPWVPTARRLWPEVPIALGGSQTMVPLVPTSPFLPGILGGARVSPTAKLNVH